MDHQPFAKSRTLKNQRLNYSGSKNYNYISFMLHCTLKSDSNLILSIKTKKYLHSTSTENENDENPNRSGIKIQFSLLFLCLVFARANFIK